MQSAKALAPWLTLGALAAAVLAAVLYWWATKDEYGSGKVYR